MGECEHELIRANRCEICGTGLNAIAAGWERRALTAEAKVAQLEQAIRHAAEELDPLGYSAGYIPPEAQEVHRELSALIAPGGGESG